jgi:hypothetical protein
MKKCSKQCVVSGEMMSHDPILQSYGSNLSVFAEYTEITLVNRRLIYVPYLPGGGGDSLV